MKGSKMNAWMSQYVQILRLNHIIFHFSHIIRWGASIRDLRVRTLWMTPLEKYVTLKFTLDQWSCDNLKLMIYNN